jgi:hypothetical protein
MMKNRLTFGLIVKDYEEAIDFYTKKLGFVVLEDVPMGQDRWVTMTLPAMVTVSLRCIKRKVKAMWP